MSVDAVFEWRGAFTNTEMNQLHAEAFETRVFSDEEWDWVRQLNEHSLGWVVARAESELVGFVNVISDGLVHAWIQDLMVALGVRHKNVGVRLIEAARSQAKRHGCEWLHVDFDAELSPFYIDACGFTPTTAGLIDLS